MTTSARRGLLTLLYLWVGLGVSLAPYRPIAGIAPTVHYAGHMTSHAPEKPTGPEPAHHHGPRCVLCVVGAGVVPVLVRVVRVERQELSTPPLPTPLIRSCTFRLFKSRAPPLTRL